jgi:hypothetical protein
VAGKPPQIIRVRERLDALDRRLHPVVLDYLNLIRLRDDRSANKKADLGGDRLLGSDVMTGGFQAGVLRGGGLVERTFPGPSGGRYGTF